jgi:hypothetical protein
MNLGFIFDIFLFKKEVKRKTQNYVLEQSFLFKNIKNNRENNMFKDHFKNKNKRVNII